MYLSNKVANLWGGSPPHRSIHPFLQQWKNSIKNKTDSDWKTKSVCCLKFNIFYHRVLFCAVRTIWGSSKPIEPLKIIKNLKLMKNYVLYYEQTSPLDVPLYAFGQTKSSLKPWFCSVCPFCIFFPIPWKRGCKKLSFLHPFYLIIWLNLLLMTSCMIYWVLWL